MSDNKSIRQAAITILLNFSILFLDKPDPEGKIQLVSAVSGGLFHKETDATSMLRLVAMLGNVSHQDGETKELVQSMVGDEMRAMKAPQTLEGADDKTTKTIKDIV